MVAAWGRRGMGRILLCHYPLGVGFSARGVIGYQIIVRTRRLSSGAMFLKSPMSATERHQLAIQFMRERDLCGIYCPDEIVRQLNIFTDRISNPKLYDDQDLQYRMLKLALRKDLRDDTKLTEQDYKF
jgi:hypothetical protein